MTGDVFCVVENVCLYWYLILKLDDRNLVVANRKYVARFFKEAHHLQANVHVCMQICFIHENGYLRCGASSR